MRHLLFTIILLLSPIFSFLAFSAVGDTIVHEGVHYVIIEETDSTALYEVAIDHMEVRPYISIPASISHNGTNYNVTSHTGTFVLPVSLDYDNPAHITKIDFSNAIHLTELPSLTYVAFTALRIDTFILPPNIEEYEAPMCMGDPRDPDPTTSSIFMKRPFGITRLFASGNKLRHVNFARGKSLVEVDISSSSVDSLTLDSTLWSAFQECFWLEKVRFNESITYFGPGAFLNCFRLDAGSFNMPDSLLSIDCYCFNAAWQLDTLRLPAKVRHLDHRFITSHTLLECIEVDTTNRWFKSIDGVLYTKSGLTVFKVPFSLNHGDTLFFREEVDSIAPYLHTNVGNAYDTNMPENPNEIHDFVFNSGLRHIGDYAFYGSSIRNAHNFGNTRISAVPYCCFSVSDLGGIEFPIELSSIASIAFANCSLLDSVRFLGSVVSTIGAGAFARCPSLETLDLSAQTRLKTISTSLCEGDSSLRTVRLPKSIDSIAPWAFYGCTSLSEIEVPVFDPIEIDPNVFEGVDKSNCRLLVPRNSIAQYKVAPVWKEFLNIEAGHSYQLTVECDSSMGETYGSGLYSPNEDVFISASPKPGYRFTGWSDLQEETLPYRTVRLTSDSVINAEFEFDPDYEYWVIVYSENSAKGKVLQTAVHAKYNETVTLTAEPANGYVFSHWSDGAQDNPYTVTITQDTTLTAYFKEHESAFHTVNVSVSDASMGTAEGGGTFEAGTVIELTASANDGYAFVEWRDNADNVYTSNPLSVTVVSDSTFTAYFQLDGTGLESVTDGIVIEVSLDGLLTVSGCEGCLMSVYTVTGVMLYSGEMKRCTLPSRGVYIVRLDGKTHKVVWR